MSPLSLRDRLAAMHINDQKPVSAEPTVILRPMVDYSEELTIPEFLLKPSPVSLQHMEFRQEWPGLNKVVFLDTETTGLSGGAGTIVFQCGMLYQEKNTMLFRQLTLGDYGDEPKMLQSISEVLEAHPLVITFNGHAFDIPLLKSRFTMLRLEGRWPEIQELDLLPPARRIWKKRLGSVKLSVLEENILRCGRTDDLPGSEAPQRFFSYLKSGEASLLDPVAEHNRLDVLSMPRLLFALLEAYEVPDPKDPPEDLLSLGRQLQRLGITEEALKCYQFASVVHPVTDIKGLRQTQVACESQYYMGMQLKREGKQEQAEQCFQKALRYPSCVRTKCLVELAKYYEHSLHNPKQALHWTQIALKDVDEKDRMELDKRKKRLLRKIQQEE